MSVRDVIGSFGSKRILIVGDLMIDEYIFGHVEKISPEAPVPVVEAKGTDVKLGGAANVANNLLSLGCEVSILGVVGKDRRGKLLKELLESSGANVDWVLEDEGRPTTVKTRIIAGSQQLLRVDWENRETVSGKILQEMLSILKKNYADFDAVIVSDYGKGAITPELFRFTGRIKRKGIVVSVDPKEKNFPVYRNVTTMTPNIKETYQATGIKPDTDDMAEEAGFRLIEMFNLDFALITRGERGLSIVSKEFIKHIPARAKQVFDVTGAGDTVISVFTLSLCSGAHPIEAAEIANAAGGIVVGKLGTATVDAEELLKSLGYDES